MRTLAIACFAGIGLVVLLGCFGAAPAAAQEKAPLEIKLPEQSFMGTPLDYWSENLELTFKKREPFLAPVGSKNVALKKPVTSSDKNPTMGKLEMITDGDKSYQETSLVELGKGLQWVQIDLKEKHALHAILVWHYHTTERVYFDVVVKVANDPDFTQDVKTLFNNDHDNSSGLGAGKDKEYIENYEGKLIDAKGAEARYVRLYTNGNTANDRSHYVEVEVYGIPAK